LGVTDEQYGAWAAELQSRGEAVPLLPELPELSNLVAMDEGNVFLDALTLRVECTSILGRMRSEDSVELITYLLKAAEFALEHRKSRVVVHPFG